MCKIKDAIERAKEIAVVSVPYEEEVKFFYIRVLHTDGRDELYKAIKTSQFPATGSMRIYTQVSSYIIDMNKVEFIQSWV